MQKLIYICAPLRGDIEGNIAKAKEYSKTVIKAGHIPICPHIMFAGLLDDNNHEERKKALEAGLRLLRFCDGLWQFGATITEGMDGEMKLARRLGIQISMMVEVDHA